MSRERLTTNNWQVTPIQVAVKKTEKPRIPEKQKISADRKTRIIKEKTEQFILCILFEINFEIDNEINKEISEIKENKTKR